MSQNTTNDPSPPKKNRGYKKYSENHTHPEATVTVDLLIYYSIF